jgi:RNA polymerase sigma-70 factor (ECF subfamily)
MGASDTVGGGGDARFRTTIWSDLARLKDRHTPEGRELLGKLLQQYWKPVYAYIRTRWGKSNEDAKDLTQDFFAMLMERGSLNAVDPKRGRFRQFMKAALEHFLIDERRSATRQKRGGDAKLFSLDPDLPIVAPGEPPEGAFDREWTRALLAWGVAALRERLQKLGKDRLFEVFREYDLEPSPGGPPSYAALAKRHGISETDVRNGLHQARDLYKLIIRHKIAEYAVDEEELLTELKEILGH